MDTEPPFVGLTIVDGTMTAGQVALAVLRKHFVAMVSKEAGTLAGSDPEDLHDMRVATRRIRAASSLFKAYLHLDVLAYREEFAWLGAALGKVRDLDVQIEHVKTWSQELSGAREAPLVPYEDVLASRRNRARAELADDLNSQRYRDLATNCGELLRSGPLPTADEGILAVAPELVEHRMKGFRKAADGLRPDDPPEQFHAARIRAKKLRYAMEFVAAVYGKAAKDAAERVVAVQDALGLHQDCVVAMALIDEIAGVERFEGRTMFALGGLRQMLEGKALDLRSGANRLLKEAHGREWADFRQVMKRALPVEPDESGEADLSDGAGEADGPGK